MAGKSVRIKRITFHTKAFNDYRRTDEVFEQLTDRGERIAAEADAASDGEHAVIVTANQSRARVIVTTADFKAMHAEAKDRTLTNALDAGRG